MRTLPLISLAAVVLVWSAAAAACSSGSGGAADGLAGGQASGSPAASASSPAASPSPSASCASSPAPGASGSTIGAAVGGAATSLPVQARYSAPGPFAVATGTVSGPGGTAAYDLFYPCSYGLLGFASPIVTWGNGTGGSPDDYTTLLTHLAAYGFTVIASTSPDTGSGAAITAAARYLVAEDHTPGSAFDDHLDTGRIAAAGHSQGAGGATNAAVDHPGLITTLITFSLPGAEWVSPNAGCRRAADCMFYPAKLTQPVFFISTHGTLDSVIASPATERAFFRSVRGQAALGIIRDSGGKRADHLTPEDTEDGGNPAGILGYATAWLEYQLLGSTTAARAFTGRHPELLANPQWPGSAVR
jgi:pimeloyl-ACP methyl ester carboxylesterase